MLMLCASGCFTDAGEPPASARVQAALQFEFDPGPTPAFTFNRGWLSFKQLRMIEARECDEEAAVDVPSTPPFEMLAWRRPSLPLIIPQRDEAYCRLDMVFEPLAATTLPVGAPAQAAGSSLVITGIIPDTQDRRVTIMIDLNQTLSLEALVDGRFTLEPRQRIHELLISIDTSDWMTSEELRAASPNARGVVFISATSNRPIYDRIITHMGDHARLYYDSNGDGDFDDAERLDPIASGGIIAP